MLLETHYSGDLSTESGMRDFFEIIRAEVKRSENATSLMNYYKLAAFLAALTDAPCWNIEHGDRIPDFSMLIGEEFRKTAREINHRAEVAGFELRVSENPHDSLRRNHRPIARSRGLVR